MTGAGGTEPPRRPLPVWRTPQEAAILIVRGATIHPAARIALVVGTLLTVVNQGGVILSGDLGAPTLVRIVANYLIPYVVSSIGFLASFRTPDSREAQSDFE